MLLVYLTLAAWTIAKIDGVRPDYPAEFLTLRIGRSQR